MRAIGLDVDFDYPKSHPLPWVKEWISGGSGQDAPQEKDKTEYIVGGIKNDVTQDTFKDFDLGVQDD
jgi:ribonucleoside-diphosphate reductase beta chain